jgi:hypothetical protein
MLTPEFTFRMNAVFKANVKVETLRISTKEFISLMQSLTNKDCGTTIFPQFHWRIRAAGDTIVRRLSGLSPPLVYQRLARG